MNASRRLGAYAVIAALCALVNIAVLIGGERAGLHFATSVTLSFVLCVLIGYALHSRVTFRAPMQLTGLWRYASVMALNYPLSIAFVWLFYDMLGLPMTVVAPCSTLALTVYNFVSSRWAILAPGRARGRS